MADFGDDRTILVPGEELLVLCACPPDEPEPLSHELDARGARFEVAWEWSNDAAREAHAAGVARLVAIPLSHF